MPCLALPDDGDLHVLAAAIAGHADCIVTAISSTFLQTLWVFMNRGHPPRRFHRDAIGSGPVVGLSALKEMRLRMKNPPRTPEEFAALLERNQLFSTAQHVREAAALM